MASDDHFRIRDCRGREVRCSEYRWNYHVTEHPEMIGREQEVMATIQKPDPGFIFQDKVKADRHIYYRRSRRGSRPVYVKVVVRFEADDSVGELITAFLTSNMKGGEQLLWKC
jgi:hypothetical protein